MAMTSISLSLPLSLSLNFVSFKQKLFFTRYLATLINSGITVSKALHILSKQFIKNPWKRILPKIIEQVEGGMTLAEALANYPELFPQFYTQMIAVGEKSGTLGDTLHYLEKQLYRDAKLRNRVTQAFAYPIIILCLFAVVAVGLVVFVIPKIKQVFQSLNITLPMMTRLVLDSGDFLSKYIVYLIIGFFLFAFSFRYAMTHFEPLRFMFHRIIISLPIFRGLVMYFNIARFSQIMSTLLQSGVPIIPSLQIAKATVTNRLYQKLVAHALSQVEGGSSLETALTSPLFPAVVTQMIAVGEETGNLPHTMGHLATLFDQEVSTRLKTLTAFIEPALLIVVAGGVAVIALSIVLPIYQLPSLLQK